MLLTKLQNKSPIGFYRALSNNKISSIYAIVAGGICALGSSTIASLGAYS